ncbi:MAG: hypothetical protein JST84_23670 [Acidobacteria bacterium]|nr:hypothetical protein [Acidobacteriota bacterium]
MKSLQRLSIFITMLLSSIVIPASVWGTGNKDPNIPQTTINWGTNATALRGQNGQRVTYTCPGGGRFGSVWGTDVYTDDSSICTAAVHAGRINVQTGGTVTIEIRAGQSQYTGSTRYGVTSAGYGGWHGSYVFVGGGQQPPPPPDTLTINWSTNAVALRGRNGQRMNYICPSNGRASGVWGTDVYTDDSSICSAAVHAGRITTQAGGKVTIEIRAGQSQYTGSLRNGVTTAGYGSWHGSYVFVGGVIQPPPPPPPPDTLTINWSTNAVALRGRNGQRMNYICPGNGRASGVWGTDVYTDDSSICTAAVHAGRINVQTGGKVTIEIRAGQSQYTGSLRNGVTTAGYGSWHGSYVFAGSAPPPPPPSVETITWAATVTALRGQNGKRVTYRCPANGSLGRVWGTDVYTDDSSVCTAAVHSGLISPQAGGVVTLEIRAGQSQYTGSTRYGVTTAGYGGWHGSYVFVRSAIATGSAADQTSR